MGSGLVVITVSFPLVWVILWLLGVNVIVWPTGLVAALLGISEPYAIPVVCTVFCIFIICECAVVGLFAVEIFIMVNLVKFCLAPNEWYVNPSLNFVHLKLNLKLKRDKSGYLISGFLPGHEEIIPCSDNSSCCIVC